MLASAGSEAPRRRCRRCSTSRLRVPMRHGGPLRSVCGSGLVYRRCTRSQASFACAAARQAPCSGGVPLAHAARTPHRLWLRQCRSRCNNCAGAASCRGHCGAKAKAGRKAGCGRLGRPLIIANVPQRRCGVAARRAARPQQLGGPGGGAQAWRHTCDRHVAAARVVGRGAAAIQRRRGWHHGVKVCIRQSWQREKTRESHTNAVQIHEAQARETSQHHNECLLAAHAIPHRSR